MTSNTPPQPACYAVLTGDLMNSSHLEPKQYDSLLDTLGAELQSLSASHDGQFDMYRGDAFQLLLAKPEKCYLAAILLKLRLLMHKADARISIGIGAIDPVHQPVKTASGEAFVLSGRGLDSINQQQLVLHAPASTFTDCMQMMIRFVDVTLSKVTPRQANALYHYLSDDDKSHQAIAGHLGTSRVNVTKLLNQCHYELIADFIAYAETLTGEFVHGR